MKLDSDERPTTMPPLPLDLSQHKLSIALHWLPILLTSGTFPIVLYFALRIGTTLSLLVVLTKPLVIIGVVSLFSVFRRSWRFFQKDGAYRPVGCEENRWSGDFFHWNFLGGFVVLAVAITVEIGVESLVMFSLPLSILMLYICIELLLAQVAMTLDLRTPFRISSLPRSSETRPGTYVMVEDVVAVDSGLGKSWREAWDRRYVADGQLRGLLRFLDMVWGVSGLCVFAVIWGVVFGVKDKEVGYGLGWALPWVWAGCMSVLTIWTVERMLRWQRAC